MANRHLSRSIVLQTLYEWDFAQKSEDDAMEIFKRNAEEFAPGVGDYSFMETLLKSILGKRKDIDLIIEKAAPDWPLDKISIVDRNILRIGLYELLFADRAQVPPKVAINEAIELAKTFGGETSGRFVNGVLGAVYKEMGEPGKDDVSKKKKDDPNKPIPVERLAGAVIYAYKGDDVYLAFVHDIFGHWTLSKGHLNDKEPDEEGVKRVIKDELGLDITPEEKLGDNEYGTYDPEKGKIKKRVTYFLAHCEYCNLQLAKSGGLDNAKWFQIGDIIDLNFYNDIYPIVTKAASMLLKESGAAAS
jgi:transcription antitermination protein NusB